MPLVNKITETLFKNIQDEMSYIDPDTVSRKNHLSMKTVLMIKGSKNYSEYKAQVTAQHPPASKPSIADHLAEISRKMMETDRKLDTLLMLNGHHQGKLL